MIRLNPVDRRWVARLAGLVIALTVLPVLGGMVLDHALRTSPVITLFMLLLGINLGVYSVARSVASLYARFASVPGLDSSRRLEL